MDMADITILCKLAPRMEKNDRSEQLQSEIVLGENEIVCSLTNRVVKATEKELTLQSMINMMAEEYDFAPSDMERDFKVKYEDENEGKSKTQKVDLAIFEEGQSHDVENLIRFIIVAKDSKVKAEDKKNGVVASLEGILSCTNCDFGCWTNGEDLQYQYSYEDNYGQVTIDSISDFPANGQTLEDLEAQGERAVPRKPANESLIKTFKRCHDYIYGNEGMKKTAFWELLNLIFCKLYDEKRRFSDAKEGISYRRRFWVGVKEQNTEEGCHTVAERIKSLFNDLKESHIFKDVFDGNEQIMLSDRGLAYVAGELAKYSFLDATVDVKGTAYETIVSNTLKQEAGQFFTPRNIIKCMVEMLDPDRNTRVLDPACGSGGFLVMVLDHVRRKITRELYPNLDDVRREAKQNSPEVDELVRDYAEKMIFGFDFDPDLKKAARMNMVMAGDGHSNIYNINSLDYPQGSKPDVALIAPAVQDSISKSADKNFDFGNVSENNAQGKFDMVFTNPPFGAKVEVDPAIAQRYELNSTAPEVLFIEACYNYLKPGGKMAIVLPDGILGNPNQESTRLWILKHFKLLASVDLPVETFLPQVGVQASLLFLQKKTEAEELIPIEEENYDVFMAIVDKVGKDRRGVPIYVKDEDGAEILYTQIKKWLALTENGHEVVRSRQERVKHLDDDLPKVAAAYKEFKEAHK
jgi:type I restriction enzyme M protein